jgi:hypothetical protein
LSKKNLEDENIESYESAYERALPPLVALLLELLLLLLGVLLLELPLLELLLNVARNDYQKDINCLITQKVIEFTRCNRQCCCIIIFLGGGEAVFN